jgi:hypothetical protein
MGFPFGIMTTDSPATVENAKSSPDIVSLGCPLR